jgi:hypothetical protein
MVGRALASTADFVASTCRTAARVAARGGTLKAARDAARADCDPRFAGCAIHEHSLPFKLARAFDEAQGIDTPRSWTAQGDRAMREALQA